MLKRRWSRLTETKVRLAVQGDAVEILVINKNGTRRDLLQLKKD